MKVGFISESKVDDKQAWSGTIYFLYNALRNKYDIYPIVVRPKVIHRTIRKIIRIFSKGKKDYTLFDQFVYGHAINRKIKIAKSKGVYTFFAPAASSILGVAKIPSDCRVVYLSDATYHCMLNYYYEGGTAGNIKRHNLAEKNSLERANAIIYSNDWAKKDAIQYYGISPHKINVLPFGANLEDRYILHGVHNVVKLLFVGVEWERKGAELAIQCVERLNKISKDRFFELTIIGLDKPTDYKNDNAVSFVGRLNKDDPDQLEQMIAYYQQSDIFLLPTKAECSAIVFCEAAMYGLPVFTHDTGGTMSYVEDGKTGRGLKIGATADDFANAILEMLNSNKYTEWSRNARKKYETELNWHVWLKKCEGIIEGNSD